MPRKKNYIAPQLPLAESAPAGFKDATPQIPGTNLASHTPVSTEPASNVAEQKDARNIVDVDMVKLLGPEARFTNSARTVVLHPNLGRGIDPWVRATSTAIERLLLSGMATVSAMGGRDGMQKFFDFLTEGARDGVLLESRPAAPVDLRPLHITQYVAWLKKHQAADGSAKSSSRSYYQTAKRVLKKMFDIGLISGESNRFFKRGVFGRDGESRRTSLSEAEQERLSFAIKEDLSAIHHGRLEVAMRELQALRYLVVAHRMGPAATPLLELRRNAIKPGLLPGTIQVETIKPRARKIISQAGSDGSKTPMVKAYLPFSLAEGVVIQMAVAATEDLVSRAPKRLQNRVWLYEASITSRGKDKSEGDVFALTYVTLYQGIAAVVKRHGLLSDDGKSLIVNNSRLRKSRFDRAFRESDGDLSITANLMGNTPSVAGRNYPSMNAARQAEAGRFMNEDLIAMMRSRGDAARNPSGTASAIYVIPIMPVDKAPTPTPVAGCSDVLGGDHSPQNGHPCDRFVMCLFCSSFAIVGTVDELWRLFSFQAFARMELDYLEIRLGPQTDESALQGLEDLLELRDRYRLVIPYIDTFTAQQFSARRVQQAREKTAAGLHPFWKVQMGFSRRARALEPKELGERPTADGPAEKEDDAGNLKNQRRGYGT